MKAIGMMILFVVSCALIAAVKTTGQEDEPKTPATQWEYLVVASPSNINLAATGNPRMRKEPIGSWGREAFVLEQHLDRLGASGWELVSIAGTPADPHYYFKRRK